jgi:uncharacterized protein (TIGR01777 family)
MRIAVGGATGLIGSALVDSLRADGHTVHRLVRRVRDRGPTDIDWNPTADRLDAKPLVGVDAVVNLAGARIDQRWTAEQKRAIRESRVASTTLLARTIASLPTPPRVFVCASAIGIYGDRGDEELDERSRFGDDFLATVVRDWESSTAVAAAAGTRVVSARSGLVIATQGGVLARLLPPFRMGLGGRLGSGRQWMSWIALEDEVRALKLALTSDALRGPVNLVAPNPVTNEEFAKTLGRVLGRPAVTPAPTFALELMFGREMVRGTLMASQRVVPRTLEAAGFLFYQPTLEGALRSLFETRV